MREYQRQTSQFTPGKNFTATGGFGPWMMTLDEIGDLDKMEITTRLNGEVMQNATSDLLVHGFAELIEYCSTFIELEPGEYWIGLTPQEGPFNTSVQLPALNMMGDGSAGYDIDGIVVPTNKPSVRDDREDLLATAICTELCSDLLDEGVKKLHFYTLNRPELTRDVCHALGVKSKARLQNVA